MNNETMFSDKPKVYISCCPKKMLEANYTKNRWDELVASLRAQGYNVINPFFSLDTTKKMKVAQYQKRWKAELLLAQNIFVEPKSIDSPKVKFELKVARMNKIKYLNPPPTSYELAYERFMKSDGGLTVTWLSNKYKISKRMLSRYILKRFEKEIEDGKRPKQNPKKPRSYWGRVKALREESEGNGEADTGV